VSRILVYVLAYYCELSLFVCSRTSAYEIDVVYYELAHFCTFDKPGENILILMLIGLPLLFC